MSKRQIVGGPLDGQPSLPDVISAQGLTGCLEPTNGATCGKKLVGRGRCRAHYMRWWRSTRGHDVTPALNLKTKTPEGRFWSKVRRGSDTQCWPWMGSASQSGHGEFFVSPGRGRVPAHAYALELHSGRVCPSDRESCHRCDNPSCCNPRHIYYGTRQQNVNDMWARQRGRRGSNCTHSKLNEQSVMSIRVRFAAGELSTHLALEYGVAESAISLIVNGRRWQHVGGPTKTHGRPGRRPIRRVA